MTGGTTDRAPEVLTYLLAEKDRLGTEFADTKNLELIFEEDE